MGYLRPLSYPEDVEPFIERWFTGRPEQAASLTSQLRDRPDLQQTATVPLLLAFYCIVGGAEPLPRHRAELYARVIMRMLAGGWRGSGARDPDPAACVDTLRAWAWSAAASNPVSGVGTWPDEILTPRVRLSQDDKDALDHVAVRLGPPDPDTDLTLRRFIHRSVHEQLVAEYVAWHLAAPEAARELLSHLWYDPDWEHAAPAALVLHPGRDQVLKELIRRIVGGDQFPADVTGVDRCGEIRRFLVRVAAESAEDAWSAEAARMIGSAVMDVITSQPRDVTGLAAAGWPASDSRILQALLRMLTEQADNPFHAEALTTAIVRFAASQDDKSAQRHALLTQLSAEMPDWKAALIGETLAQLHPSDDERAQARTALHRRLLANADVPAELARALKKLDPSRAERAHVRAALMTQLAGEASTARIGQLAQAIMHLGPVGQERGRLRALSLRLLLVPNPILAVRLAQVISRLNPTQAQRESALRRLPGHFIPRKTLFLQPKNDLIDAIRSLAGTAGQRRLAQDGLLHLIDSAASSRVVMEYDQENLPVPAIAEAMFRLAATDDERAWVRDALLGVFGRTAKQHVGRELLGVATSSAASSAERARIRDATARRLAVAEIPGWQARELAAAYTVLAVTPDEQDGVRETLLELFSRGTGVEQVRELAAAILKLPGSPDEQARAPGTTGCTVHRGDRSSYSDGAGRDDPAARARSARPGSGATCVRRARPEDRPEEHLTGTYCASCEARPAGHLGGPREAAGGLARQGRIRWWPGRRASSPRKSRAGPRPPRNAREH